jgi:hypothetical protein
VKKDRAIDGHAWTNTTSVYTPAGVFPMLPEKLSTDLTSLGESAERLAVVTQMTVSPDGEVTASARYRAVVRNHGKLAYNGIGAWLEGKGPAPDKLAAVPGLEGQIRLQDRVAQALRRRRTAQGALRLESMEVRAVFDDGGLADLRPDQKNRAKELIEDFMIAANGVTARYLDEKRMPSLRRVPRGAEALGSNRRPRSGVGLCPAPRGPMPSPSMRSSPSSGRPTRFAFPTSRCRSSSCWAPANTRSRSRGSRLRDTSVLRCATMRTRLRRIAGFRISSRSAC